MTQYRTAAGTRVAWPRAFRLERHEDVTGVSGVGVVAWGVEFPDGVVALRWCSEWPTSVVFHDRGMEAVRAVHGHGGATEIVWLDEVAGPRPTKIQGIPEDEWVEAAGQRRRTEAERIVAADQYHNKIGQR